MLDIWEQHTGSIAAYVFVVVLGLLWGSFANVCIYRWPPTEEFPKGRSVVRPGSHCFACKQPIAWYDNMPLIAWLWLRGKCRNCGTRISIRYPLVEAANAAGWWAVAALYGPALGAAVAMPLVTGLMNYVVPLQIGARDVSFPFLNNFSFWMTTAGAIIIMISLFIGEFARTGWLAYPPLSGADYSPGVGVDRLADFICELGPSPLARPTPIIAGTETVPVERVRLGKESVRDEETVTGDVRKEQIEADLPEEDGRRRFQ
jgi:hypothetical protein